MSDEQFPVGRIDIELRPDHNVAIRIFGPKSDQLPTAQEKQDMLDAAAAALYYEGMHLMQIRRRVENVSRVKNFVSNLERIRGSKGESES